ncbi:enamine deaminase RidA (YjgF/YER057c/UK114 family) [Allocatelliglobosispora scoriae]|uniref:Enamine deaminase RidA (YjgF/YER057c/UK114 family) n=1 Tax=Allocatelliglobosispora scoriae TaxID=643052 RepID=A0A841BPI9_9ACTN|nr:RidA family protein [Allocatelliglobosispora scoriae]MBB5869216.1 enamine deaminase RidA (YjgF/YER057c/UK114 family) [Allocatelliglobosispora scoriae]
MPIIDRLASVSDLPDSHGYAHAVVASGPLAFIAGQVAMDADGNLVGADDIRAQTEQAMRNLEAILTTLGAGWADVARLGWYVLDTCLVDGTGLQVIRDVRDEFLRPALGDRVNPASTLIGVGGLFRPGYLVEVDAVVAVPERGRRSS